MLVAAHGECFCKRISAGLSYLLLTWTRSLLVKPCFQIILTVSLRLFPSKCGLEKTPAFQP